MRNTPANREVVSSMLVHAPARPGEPIDEAAPLDPKLPYLESQALIKRLLEEEAGDIPAVVLRPAGVYDEGGHSAFLAQQIARIYERRLIGRFYPGDLATGQPYLHLEDLTRAVQRTVAHGLDLPAHTALLPGETDVLWYGELQRILGRLLHDEAWTTVSISPELARAGTWALEAVLNEDVFQKPWMIDIANDHYELDISRARKLIGWTPAHALEETSPAIVDRLREDPFAWYRENGQNAAGIERTTGPLATADPVEARQELRAHDKSITRMHRDMFWVHFGAMAMGLWLAFGLWLAASPYLLESGQTGGIVSTTLVGLLLTSLSLPQGRRSPEHYGEWGRWMV